MERDYDRQVVISLRLVAKPSNEPRALRASPVANLVPPPVSCSFFAKNYRYISSKLRQNELACFCFAGTLPPRYNTCICLLRGLEAQKNSRTL